MSVADEVLMANEAYAKSLSQGIMPMPPAHFHAFKDLAVNVREQVQKLKAHPWIPKQVPVRGFIYDVKTGKLNEVAG